MITVKSLALIEIGFMPGYTNEKLYIIQYGDHVMYVGQSTGKGGYDLPCRLGRHFGANIDGCMRQNDRSGASRQLNTMLSKLPHDIRTNFTITMLNPCDLSAVCDLENIELRLRMISAGVDASEIIGNKQSKKVIDFCEKALAWSLKPVFCKAGYCDGSSGLPDELITHLVI